MFISAIAFQKNSVLLLGKKVGRNFWQPSVFWKFVLTAHVPITRF